MKRRAFLSAVVAGTAGLAGCGDFEGSGPSRGTLGIPDEGDGGGAPDLDTPEGLSRTVRSRIGPRRTLAVSDVPGRTTPSGTRVTAGFVEPGSTDSPPRLWVGLTNVSDDERTLPFGPTPPFSGYHGRTITWGYPSDEHLLLVPDDDREYASHDLVVPDRPGNRSLASDPPGGEETTTDDGDRTTTTGNLDGSCWRAASYFAGPSRRTSVTLAPGESLTGEYAVLFSHDVPTCPPRRGGYVFQNSYEGFPLVISTWDPALEPPRGTNLRESSPGLPGYDGTVWYHRTDGSSRVYLEPETDRLELPRDETTVTLQNFSLRAMRTPADVWELYKLQDGEWKAIRPWTRTGRPLVVPPGGGDRIRLQVASGREPPEEERSFVPGLGGGLYAVRHGTTGVVDQRGNRPLRVDARTDGDVRIVYAALLELAGDPVGLLPPDAVNRTERREGDLWAWAVESGSGGIDHLRLRTVDGQPTPRLIPEQVNQSPALQHALAVLRDRNVEAVTLATDHMSVVDPVDRFGGVRDGVEFTFDGQGYEAEATIAI